MTRNSVVSCLISCEFFVLSVQAAAQGTCTRADLQSAVDGYLAAQRSGSPLSLPLASPVKYIENTGVPTGMKLTNRRFIADQEIGAVVGFIR